MSALAALLSTLKEARAERVFFAPGEVGQALDGNVSRPIDGGPMAPSVLLRAASELLSQDEVQSLPTSRPRIVRHEHDGDDYVIEVARQPAGVAIGVRLAKSTLRRDPEPTREPRIGSVRQSPPEPLPLTPAEPLPLMTPMEMPAVTPEAIDEAPPRRGSRRFRAMREKHTIRVELDDEGNPIDSTAIDLDAKAPGEPAKAPAEPPKPTRRLSKPFKRASSMHMQAGGRVYETRMIPRAGQIATNTEIAGSPHGAYVTFLFAPSGFSLVLEGEGAVVIAKTDDAAIRGELYVGPTMKLRVVQGPKESLVTFYRLQPAK